MTDKPKLKAWLVESADSGSHSLSVIAETRNEAKKMAHYHDWLCDVDWIELRVTRQKEFDEHAELFGKCVVNDSGAGPEQAKVLRDLGWYEYDRSMTPCGSCGLYVWKDLPESQLNENDECMECAND